MKYIATYYPVPQSERSIVMKRDEYIKQFNELTDACNRYEADIIKAINDAYRKHIEKYLDKGLLYSKTWGK